MQSRPTTDFVSFPRSLRFTLQIAAPASSEGELGDVLYAAHRVCSAEPQDRGSSGDAASGGVGDGESPFSGWDVPPVRTTARKGERSPAHPQRTCHDVMFSLVLR